MDTPTRPIFPRRAPRVVSYPVPVPAEPDGAPQDRGKRYVTEPGRAEPPVPPAGKKAKRSKRRWRRKLLLALIAPLVLVQIIAFMFSMGVTPPRTAYMLEAGEPNVYQFVSINT